MSVQAKLSGTLQITDNLTGSVSLSKVISEAYTGTLSTYGQSVLVGTTSYTVVLPLSPVQFVYVRNLSSTAGTTITVTWTPTSGASATVLTLDPGAMIFLCENTTTNGISALSFVSNQVGTPVEFALAG